jgi:hypothetical protein
MPMPLVISNQGSSPGIPTNSTDKKTFNFGLE